MYSVSNAYRVAAALPIQEHRLTGTIGGYAFTENHIVAGTFHLTNQCTDTADVVLGSVFVGQLEATFTGINIGFNEWIGKIITPLFGLKVGENTWEDIPLGVYTIIEARHTAEGVSVVAYDNMYKFDKKFKKGRFQMTGGIDAFIAQACADCRVDFGMTDEEVEALPNGMEVFELFGAGGKTKDFANDIETYRDLIFWIAQTLGCFATIDRLGRLVFRLFKNDVVDEISQLYRLSGAEFADYITNYTGIYVNNMIDDTESYYGYDVALLEAEIALVQSEILQTDGDIAQNQQDMIELERAHDAHEITDEEYATQKAQLEAERSSLNKTKKQLQKRLNWLLKALEKAQAGDDGTFMELGDNPFLQSDINTYRERERRRILNAVDKISYTPFRCSTVIGIHYDLGDVVYFTGGHAGSDGVFCCLMMYDWTFNGEYQMQGFGADPSIANVKDKVEKTVNKANENALNMARSTVGVTDTSDEPYGKDGDFYFTKPDKEYYDPNDTCINQGYFSTPTITLEDDKLNVESHLQSDIAEWMIFKIEGLTVGTEYTLQSTFQQTPSDDFEDDGYNGIWPWGMSPANVSNLANAICVCDVYPYNIGDANWGVLWTGENNEDAGAIWDVTVKDQNDQSIEGTLHGITLEYDASEHDYKLPFTAGNSTMYVVLLMTRWTTSKLFYAGGPTYRNIKWNFTSFWSNGVEFPVMKYYDTEKGGWTDLDYVAKTEESTEPDTKTGIGLEVVNKEIKLKPSIMRAWFKADPPQVKRTFNQYCVRFTGKPDSNIDISLQSNTGWLNKSIKKDSEGVFTLKSGGTVSSGVIEYCAYKITGLTSGQRYYFNFKCNFKDSTTFDKNYNKGLGLVFNTTGTIDTDNWSGNPDTFDEENLYYSMRRTAVGNFANFSFVATAATMYMCVVVADIANSQASSLTLSKMVISKTERACIRDFYIFDLVSNDWLPYKPWGSGSDSGDAGASSLGDLDDVNLGSLSNGQILYYDSTTGQWVNRDSYELPVASANTLGGIKVGNRLSIDENGVLSADDQSYTLPVASASRLGGIKVGQNLSIDENGVLSATGGGGGASSISELSDVAISSLSNGQVLKYNTTTQKWENANESGGSGGSDSKLIKDMDWTALIDAAGNTTISLSDNYDYYLWVVEFNGWIEHVKLIDATVMDLTELTAIAEYVYWQDSRGNFTNNAIEITSTSIVATTGYSGVVTKVYGANASGGGTGGASELADLDDVDLGTLANGDVLKYNSTAQKWENGSVGNSPSNLDYSNNVADKTRINSILGQYVTNNYVSTFVCRINVTTAYTSSNLDTKMVQGLPSGFDISDTKIPLQVYTSDTSSDVKFYLYKDGIYNKTAVPVGNYVIVGSYIPQWY